MEPSRPALGLGARAALLVDDSVADAAAFRFGVVRGSRAETLVDCGHRHPRGTEAGLCLARIGLAVLGEVILVPSGGTSLPWSVLVRISRPGRASLGRRFAGWALSRRCGLSGPRGLLPSPA